MHIVILYQHYLRPDEAGHSRVNEYARLWSAMGHSVSVLTGQTSYMTGRKPKEYNWRFCVQETDQAVRIYRCFVPGNSNKSFVRRTFAYIAFAVSSTLVSWRLRDPHVLLVSSPPLTIGLPALAIKAFRRIPMVFEVRDLWPESAVATGVLTNRHMIRVLSWLERRCYAAAVRINALTPAFKANIVDRGLVTPEEISVIPIGVDLEEMHPSKRSRRVREELGWGDRKVVLYTGAIGRANCLSQLVETGKLLRDRPDILIAIVGGGMDASAIQQKIDEAGLTNVVLHGARSKTEMPAITATADICTAVLLKSDTFKTVYPNKVFDYMACARPIVLGIDGIIREVVEREDAGIFAEPENPVALRDAILTLIDNPQRAVECGQNGRKFVEQEFDRREMANRFSKLLEDAVSISK